jgi:23S rRNA (adenine2503-C2)-methyltransferase
MEPALLPFPARSAPPARLGQVRLGQVRLGELRAQIAALGAKACHEERLLRGWLQGCGYDKKHSPAATFFPLALREALPEIEANLARLAQLNSEHPADAGVARLLVGLHDGQTVESVLLPRGGLCVSTQVGCAVGCAFCMSGRDGLVRPLGSAEILAQVALARRRRAVSKVVFMGMGEPAHNLDNVLEAIQALGLHGNIGHKNLVLSTVGDVRVFERLMAGLHGVAEPDSGMEAGSQGYPPPQPSPEGRGRGRGRGSGRERPSSISLVRPALAVSLHTTDAALRAELLPRAPKIAIEELVARAEAYARATHYPTQYQWTLIEGVNDGDAELERIAELLAGKYAVLNFIPFNAVDGLAFRRPAPARIAHILHTLNARGIYTRIRDSAGQEVEGACGQLRARALRA